MKPQHATISTLSTLGMVMGLVFAFPTYATTQYKFTDLGGLGGNYSYASSINNSGQIVGTSSDGVVSYYIGPIPVYERHAFIYDNGSMKDLGTLGGRHSEAISINDNGQVIGHSSTSVSYHPFLYSNGTMQDLGTFGGTNALVSDINNNGVIAGAVYIPGNANYRGIIDNNGTLVGTGLLPGASQKYDSGIGYPPFSYPNAINDNGLVVGHGTSPDGVNFHAFLYNGSIQDLGTLGGLYSEANDINNNGEVVGVSDVVGDQTSHATLWSNGTITDLGTLGGNLSDAYSINNKGQVVGYSETGHGASPFLWDKGTMTDLNSLLDAATINAGWYLQSATDINDNGWIVGQASNHITGISSAYLLSTITPVPEPESYALLLAGLGVVGVRLRLSKRTD